MKHGLERWIESWFCYLCQRTICMWTDHGYGCPCRRFYQKEQSDLEKIADLKRKRASR